MAQNDVTVSDVLGVDAGFYTGNAIPSGITSSSALFLIIPVSNAHAKATLATEPLIASTYTEADYNTATDALALINACYYAYTELNSKPTNLRKFGVSFIGLGGDSFFEGDNELFITRQTQLTLYSATNTALGFDPVETTLV